MVNWEEVRYEWESIAVSFKELAKKHEIKDATIRSRKNRGKWQRNDATPRSTKKKSRGAPKVNRAHKNPQNTFSQGDTAALKHGLFSRYMPQETLDIMGKIAGADPVDLLWMQIELRFTAIIRAQEIMVLESKEDTIKVTTKERSDHFDTEALTTIILHGTAKHYS